MSREKISKTSLIKKPLICHECNKILSEFIKDGTLYYCPECKYKLLGNELSFNLKIQKASNPFVYIATLFMFIIGAVSDFSLTTKIVIMILLPPIFGIKSFRIQAR